MGTTAGFWVSVFVTAFGFCLVLAYHLVFFSPPSASVFSIPLPCMQVTLLPLDVVEFCYFLRFFLMS